MLDDPKMADSAFNIGLAYSTDGVNPFRSGQYTLWPMVVKILNLKPALASRTALLILAGVIHGPKKPKSLQAYQYCLTDELDLGYRGLTCELSGGGAFRFRTKLCLHTCDGPANSAVTNQQGAGALWGCIKCEIEGATTLGRVLYGGVRRYLPPDHRYRTDPAYGNPELRTPPPIRTIEDSRLQAMSEGLAQAIVALAQAAGSKKQKTAVTSNTKVLDNCLIIMGLLSDIYYPYLVVLLSDFDRWSDFFGIIFGLYY